MPRATPVLFFMMSGLLMILSGCAGNNAVVQKGVFQQRKYVNPGWFVELGHHERIDHDRKMIGRPVVLQTRPAFQPQQDSVAEEVQPTTEEQDTMAVHDTGATLGSGRGEDRVEASSASTLTWDEMNAKTGMDLRPLDTMGEPFIYAPAPTDDVGGVDIFALLGFIFAFLFPVAGIVLSAIGLHRTRGGGNGHGLALAGLIIGIVFLIAFGAVLI